MVINVIIKIKWDSYEGHDVDNEPYNKFIVNLAAWVSASLGMVVGIIWYVS